MNEENTETIDEQRTTEESVRLADKLPLPPAHKCPKCGRIFASGPALRMHTVRAHGKGWDTSANFGRGGRRRAQTEEQRLSIRRAYQKQLRARYYREGKNSRGQQMPPGWKPRYQKARYPDGRSKGGNKGMTLSKWSPERLAKFRRTMKKKAIQRARNMLLEGVSKKRIQIVYPEPKVATIDEAIRNTWPQDEKEAQSVVIPTLKYCPNCGEHLEGWRHQ